MEAETVAGGDALAKLRSYLSSLPPGPITDTSVVEELLVQCWECLSGANDTRMVAYKIHRMENAEWNPPLLQFEIERHGGTVWGSSKAELQSWTVDVEHGTASV